MSVVAINQKDDRFVLAKGAPEVMKEFLVDKSGAVIFMAVFWLVFDATVLTKKRIVSGTWFLVFEFAWLLERRTDQLRRRVHSTDDGGLPGHRARLCPAGRPLVLFPLTSHLVYRVGMFCPIHFGCKFRHC